MNDDLEVVRKAAQDWPHHDIGRALEVGAALARLVLKTICSAPAHDAGCDMWGQWRQQSCSCTMRSRIAQAAREIRGEATTTQTIEKRCALCGSPAEFHLDEQIWRHKGEPWDSDTLGQTFCDKYGYPIPVVDAKAALTAAESAEGNAQSSPFLDGAPGHG